MSQLCNLFYWRSILAEFLGTALYTCLVLGVSLSSDESKIDDQLRIALSVGLTVACVSHMFAPSSGGHINPAISLSCVIARRISILQTIGYLIVQCGGAITGAAIIFALTPSGRRDDLGVLSLRNSTTYWQGFAMEGILGFFVSFVYLSAFDVNREDKSFGPGLAYGFATAAGHLLAVPYTSCGINPARALAPAIIKSHWPSYHWIYWAGPIVGAVLAGSLYALVFSVPEESYSGRADFTRSNDYIIERPPGLDGDKARVNGSSGYGNTTM
ncbi:aquaporin AQPAe.a-like [Rhopilema esculentum]|uniref:aquaporin AQPAe.a-like n=1 Tax=Rhopilema esculentum TaxID=499914 RepID=UPI0031D9ABF8